LKTIRYIYLIVHQFEEIYMFMLIFILYGYLCYLFFF
jgi:hypothetical protein